MNKLDIELKDKKDFVSKYNNNRISKELYNYIKDEVKLTDINYKINIRIKPQFKMTDEEKKLLATNIKKTCKEEITDIEYIENKVLLKELMILLIGIIITFIWYFLKSVDFISEIFLITGWLFVWEALDRLIFKRTKNKITKIRLNNILNSDIDFID